MNNTMHIKNYFITLFLGICLVTVNLHAETSKAFTKEHKKLEYFLPQLKKLAKKTSNKKILKHVNEVISYSHKVLHAGSKAKPKTVKKAVNALLRAIEYLHQLKNETSSKSQKSSKEIDLETAIAQHFSQIKGEIQGILTHLQTNAAYNAPSAILSVPYTITRPGNYYLPKNLSYKGNKAAITILANNVIVNFYNNTISLTNQSATAVQIQDINECIIKNGSIQAAVKGIGISGCSGVVIEDFYMQGAGIVIDNSSGITLNNCSIIANMQVSANALIIQGATEHISISNSTISGWANSIMASQITGLQIEDCIIQGSDTTGGNLLKLGDDSSVANAIQIQNTTFIQQMLHSNFDALAFFNGSGCLLENVLVDTTTSSSASYSPGAIHIGSKTSSYNNIFAKNCVIKGTNDYGLYIEKSSNTTMNNVEFTKATVSNILIDEGASGCLIKSCKVSDAAGSGIIINAGATANAIVNCEIGNNSQNGIDIQQHAFNTQILKNNVFDNGNFGILNSDTSTATHFNISCNNAVSDCPAGGVSPEQAPGLTPNMPGFNICCVP